MHEVIFESDTRGSKLFDIVLLWAIIISIITVMLESVSSVELEFGHWLRIIEWVFTILFTIEYIARVVSVGRSFSYIFSFFGIVDFLAIVPTYISFIFAGSQYLLVVRTLRLLRVFRILKLGRYIGAARGLGLALKESRQKITVFLGAVFSLVVIAGTIMYLVESHQSGFTSIPKSIYWAIVTLTTVGYGDIAPVTVLGQTLASFIMIMGYAIIAVPTGIVTVELSKIGDNKSLSSIKKCIECSAEGHDTDAKYCKYCGTNL